MPSTIQKLKNKNLFKSNVPSWLPNNVQYECIMGSNAYGVSSESSDLDIYGFAIPKKETLFPHLGGMILVPKSREQGDGWETFGPDTTERFTQFQEHHIWSQDELGGKGREYDITIFNIVKYFKLLMDNNPNTLDSLFVPYECVVYCTEVGNMVREKRHIFLHKGAFEKFKGYAYSQMHKMSSKNPKSGSKRAEYRKDYGYDVKYGLHLVRLLDECEQLLAHGDIDLRRNKEQLKAIRRGEMTEKQVREWAAGKEKHLENLFNSSKLPEKPRFKEIKNLLINCLEQHYGSLDKCVENTDKYENIVREIQQLIGGI